MLIAQITDLHLRAESRLAYGVVDTGALLDRALDALLALRPIPDLVLVSGDLAYDGREEEYREIARRLARLPMPMCAVPGNHDDRGRLRAAFPIEVFAAPHPEFVQYAVETGPVRVLALDTLVPGQAHGELCAARLAWLEDRLKEAPDRPTVLTMHHPPVLTGIAHMDAIRCLDGADLLGGLVRRHPNVERILSGHLHRPIQVRWNGTLVVVAPSSAHQVVLDLQPEGPAAFTLEPPAYLLHQWIPGTGIVTHQAYVGSYPGPYRFDPDPTPA